MNGQPGGDSLLHLDATCATPKLKLSCTSSLNVRRYPPFGTNLLWFKVSPPRKVPLEQSLSLWSASLHLPRQGKTLGKIMFLQCLYEIWKARNAAKYNMTPPHTSHILNTVRKSLCEGISLHHPNWSPDRSTATLLTSLGLTTHPSPPKLPIEVKWLKPDPNWSKLNVDGAAKGNPGPSGAGGLFRDHHGMFLLGFSCPTKHNTNTFAEFFALYRGLTLWFELHPTSQEPLWIESDSTLVVNTVLGKFKATPKTQPYVLHIQALLSSLKSWKISHIFREGNKPADKLASFGIHNTIETVWHSPPAFIATLVDDDANEIPSYRFPKT
ncbi:hypothetical protein QJS10_CPB22g00001 [Acorus calamus]|uniref:RNase H type-1 domain-containing protein n=1 Tax=Acorus calamus TaxID=4465 RepID=A0AAV9BYQ3_ACOCL|nr:hypothetical protein QJS10_CPB22g00001 [Acorus calamus]